MTDIIEKIITWAENEPDIRALILEGSMVSGAKTDELSDFDLNLYVTDDSKYAESNEWIYFFDEVIVYQKPDFIYEKWHIPSRLVVYKNSHRVDFSFWNIEILKHFIDKQSLPEFYKNGYKVLLDKGNYASTLPKPTHDGYAISKPSKDEVLKTIYDFWYEAYCVAKYLKRESIFFSKMIENGYLKIFLLRMILWHEAVLTEWGRNDIHRMGKDIEQKIDRQVKDILPRFFSGYSRNDTIQSLDAMMEFFREISIEVCRNLGIEYPKIRTENIKRYIKTL